MVYIFIISYFVLCCFHCSRMEDLACTGDSIFSRLSAYNPLNSTTPEFSTLDLHGQSLKTLQDYLKGLTPYVTVAMDSNLVDSQIPYGTVVCIPKLNEKYGKNIRFEVRDTRSELDGLGFNRASVCVESAEDLIEESINSLVNMRLPSGTIKDEEEEDDSNAKNLISDIDIVNYPGLREDYSAQKRDQYGSGAYYYPPYYYPPMEKTTTTEKPYYPPYPPYPYPSYPYYPYPPPPYGYDYYKTTTTTPKPYPYYPPASAYYYYPYQNSPSNNMYGYSNSYYNVSYDPPTPNYKPRPISNTKAPYNYGSYPNYYAPPPPPSNNYPPRPAPNNNYDQPSYDSNSSPY